MCHLRDTLKDESYFQERYEKDVKGFYEACQDYSEILATKGEGFSGIRICCIDISTKFEMKFYSGYSLGISKNDLMLGDSEFLDSILKTWIGDAYSDMMFLLSISIIFNRDKDTVGSILGLLLKYKYKDFVFDTMAHYLDSKFEIRTDKLKFNRSSKTILKVINASNIDKKEAVLQLKHYLDKEWLKIQRGGIISNQDHLSKDQYRGYWCIEAPALVKMLNLNDDILKSCKYYPYDLIHY